MRDNSASRIRFFTSKDDPRKGPFLNVTQKSGNDCIVSAKLEADMYCVPQIGGANTLALINILEELRNLSISPSDLGPKK
jgi:hypothetical protein